MELKLDHRAIARALVIIDIFPCPVGIDFCAHDPPPKISSIPHRFFFLWLYGQIDIVQRASVYNWTQCSAKANPNRSFGALAADIDCRCALCTTISITTNTRPNRERQLVFNIFVAPCCYAVKNTLLSIGNVYILSFSRYTPSEKVPCLTWISPPKEKRGQTQRRHQRRQQQQTTCLSLANFCLSHWKVTRPSTSLSLSFQPMSRSAAAAAAASPNPKRPLESFLRSAEHQLYNTAHASLVGDVSLIRSTSKKKRCPSTTFERNKEW
jgi:hypothetical protein